MFTQFRTHYPQGCLVSELVTVERDRFVVRALAQIEGVTLATSLGEGDTVEAAEDRAKNRLFEFLGLVAPQKIPEQKIPVRSEKISSLPNNIPVPPSEVPSSPVSPSTTIERDSSPISPDVPIPPSQPEPIAPSPPLPKAEVTPSKLPEIVEPEPTIAVEVTEGVTESARSKDNVVEPIEQSPPQTASVPNFPDQRVSVEMIQRSNQLIKRLGWTEDQGRTYLLETYGKRSRLHLSDDELVEFLHYLEELEGQLTPQ
ncbi:hypothetical protein IQ249_20915 [Lusitaniella coriacea LEGE 07157]|uniref:Uncharacterized protein n=1 Tax=Lusitaniella coriacea LEGE 07157 TaxID=945747 RepID=A0A8J7DZ99_9CYAN|nr:hypothetical protein [Lusitaniella coriacea]MBE9118357.1 hypothetical protein [Lusitaniella coriacea LEGE 07157]